MKKITMLFLLLTAMVAMMARDEGDTLDAMAKAFVYVESRGKCITGDNGRSVGVLQISKIMVDEANRCISTKFYDYNDRLDSAMSVAIFKTIMVCKNYPYDLMKACKIWNPGASKKYYTQVKRMFDLYIKQYD